MMAGSAMPDGIKRETIVNELLRRLSNTSLNHPNTKVNTIEAVNNFMITMKRSGYSEKIRRETCISAFKGFNRKRQEATALGKPLH